MNPAAHHRIADANWKTVRDCPYQVAVLPWGATERHNYHLPYSTDTVQCTFVAEQAAQRVWAEGRRVAVLPAIPFGVQSAQRDVKFNMNLRPTTQLVILRDIVQSLEHQGLRKLLIINGHGGNNFVPLLRELYLETRVGLFTCDWFRAADPARHFASPGDHADELETSVMMHIAPHLVRPLAEAGAGRARRLKISALRDGWAWTQRGWLNVVTEDTGVGDPAQANADKGQRFVEAAIANVAQLMREIADADLNDLYE